MAVSNLNNYIDKIRNHEGEAEMSEVIKAQNYYSEHQQKNHTPRVMQSLGLQTKISNYSVLTTCLANYCFRKRPICNNYYKYKKRYNKWQNSNKREFKTILFKSIR